MKFPVNTEDLRLSGEIHNVNLIAALNEILDEFYTHVPDVYILRELLHNVNDLKEISEDVEKAKTLYQSAFDKWGDQQIVLDADKYYPQVMLLAFIIISRDYEYNVLKSNLLNGLDIDNVVISLFSREMFVLSVENTE